jgi:RNA polymerase sigma factor (sigma-70 family)
LGIKASEKSASGVPERPGAAPARSQEVYRPDGRRTDAPTCGPRDVLLRGRNTPGARGRSQRASATRAVSGTPDGERLSMRSPTSSRRRHTRCLGGAAMQTTLLPAVRLPSNAPILRRLQDRGVSMRPLPDEDAEHFESRVETALMALFRDEGGESAFQALHDYASGRLLSWIAGLIGHRRGLDPLEVLQDAFVNIYRYAKGFRDDGPRSFRVWSRTIVGNLIRRARTHDGAKSLDALPEGVSEPSDRRAGPIDALTEDEDRRSMTNAWLIVLLQYAAAYERLAPRDRLALDLIEVQGLSYAQAGARLKVGLSNMKMIMFRSRRRIRSQIARQFEERERRLAG